MARGVTQVNTRAFVNNPELVKSEMKGTKHLISLK